MDSPPRSPESCDPHDLCRHSPAGRHSLSTHCMKEGHPSSLLPSKKGIKKTSRAASRQTASLCDIHGFPLCFYCTDVNCTEQLGCPLCCQSAHKKCSLGSLRSVDLDLGNLRLDFHTFAKQKIRKHFQKNLGLVLRKFRRRLEGLFNERLDQKIDAYDHLVKKIKPFHVLEGSEVCILPATPTTPARVTLREQVRLASWIKLHYLKLLTTFESRLPDLFGFREAPSLITPEVVGESNEAVFRKLIPPAQHFKPRMAINGKGSFRIE